MESNSICSICGKEKESHYNEYAQRTFFIECECEKKLRLKKEEEARKKALEFYYGKRTSASRVLKREESALFSNMIIDEHNKKAVDAAKYITALMLKGHNTQGKNGMIFSGSRGSGKTYIAVSVINEYNRGEPVNENSVKEIIKAHNNGLKDIDFDIDSRCRFIKERDVINLSEKFNYRDNTSPIDEFKNAKILVVDDVGSSYGDSRKIMCCLFDLFDYRYSQQLSTIITTNLSKEELQAYLGERTYDRLRCCCHYIKLTSPESRRS